MRRAIGLDQLGHELGDLYDEVGDLQDDCDNYTDLVDQYKRGQVSPERMEDAVFDMAGLANEWNEELRDLNEVKRALNFFRTRSEEEDYERINQELGEELESRGFEVPKRMAGSSYEISATENEIAHQCFIEEAGELNQVDDSMSAGEKLYTIIDTIDNEVKEILEETRKYEMEFLVKNLDKTVSGAELDLKDGYVRASIDQHMENQKAEEIRANPRDIYLGGFESEEGIKDLNVARKKVREKVPRGKVPNEGPTEEEIEENNRRIQEKLEEVRNRSDRGIQ